MSTRLVRALVNIPVGILGTIYTLALFILRATTYPLSCCKMTHPIYAFLNDAYSASFYTTLELFNATFGNTRHSLEAKSQYFQQKFIPLYKKSDLSDKKDDILQSISLNCRKLIALCVNDHLSNLINVFFNNAIKVVLAILKLSDEQKKELKIYNPLIDLFTEIESKVTTYAADFDLDYHEYWKNLLIDIETSVTKLQTINHILHSKESFSEKLKLVKKLKL